MIYVCKPITREYCQIAGNLAVRMNMNEHTAWLVTLASAALAFATLLIATLLLTTCDRDSFNCPCNRGACNPAHCNPGALQSSPLKDYPRSAIVHRGVYFGTQPIPPEEGGPLPWRPGPPHPIPPRGGEVRYPGALAHIYIDL